MLRNNHNFSRLSKPLCFLSAISRRTGKSVIRTISSTAKNTNQRSSPNHNSGLLIWKSLQSNEMVFKMVCASVASGFTSLTTLAIFYCMVCEIQPLIIISTTIASFFSGALAALEGNSGKDQTTSNRTSAKENVSSQTTITSQGNATSFGCVIGLVTGIISGYFTKTLEEPWRK